MKRKLKEYWKKRNDYKVFGDYMSIFSDYVRAAATKKNLLPEEWLADVAKKADRCTFVTHVGKFSNPYVKTLWQAEINSNPDDAYVSTASAECSTDISVSTGAFLPTAGLLALELEDGRTFYEHLLADDEDIRKDVLSWDAGMDYDALRDEFLSAKTFERPRATDRRLYQVYFPVGDDDYHLLTVLPPSSLMLEVKRRIVGRNHESYEVWKNTGKASKTRRFHITQTAFGGSHPSNISYGNNKATGRLFMLQSMPPVLKKPDVFYPRRDFFRELYLGEFRRLFFKLHGRYKDGRHNNDVRQSVRDVEAMIMEKIMIKVHALRQGPEGWSSNRNISSAQAAWLDDLYADKRRDSKLMQEIADDFACWMIDSYHQIVKEKSVELGDGELKALSNEFIDFLKNEMKVR